MIKKSISLFLSLITLGFFGSNFIACSNGNPGVSYEDFPTDPQYPNTFFTGVRGVSGSNDVYISGGYSSSSTTALLYQGPLSGGGIWNPIVPSPTLSPGNTISSSNLYGPDNSAVEGDVNLVGTYRIENDNTTYGFFYSGAPDGSGNTWLNLDPSSLLEVGDILLGTVPHSNMNGIVVGNFDTQVKSGRVFIYNTSNSVYYELTKSGTTSITAYGIWWNGGTSYTITGGYRDPLNPTEGEVGYLVDWDSATQEAKNWQAYNYQNDLTLLTHFEGISGDGSGNYTLAADWLTSDSSGAGAAFAQVNRNSDNSFGTADWTEIVFPTSDSDTTANTVYLNNILGVYILTGSTATNPYVATVNN